MVVTLAFDEANFLIGRYVGEPVHIARGLADFQQIDPCAGSQSEVCDPLVLLATQAADDLAHLHKIIGVGDHSSANAIAVARSPDELYTQPVIVIGVVTVERRARCRLELSKQEIDKTILVVIACSDVQSEAPNAG